MIIKKPKLIITESKDNQYYFELLGGNGQTILTSETYSTVGSCKRAMTNAKKRMGSALL